CEAAGRAFGRFQRILADLPGGALPPTIPGFLELAGYLDAFDAAGRGNGSADRALAEACGGMAFIDARRDLAQQFPPGDDLIHGDCKLNNLLFDAHAPSVRAVLDLDTVMTGHWAWDFGDLARSALAGTLSAEAAAPALAALTRGFADGSGRVLTPATVAGAPVYVAFMLGVRFLTDHLLGDRYFRVSHTGENLSRARTQFELVRLLESIPAPADALAPAATRE
ncbi:MAG: aminoglycoside phosphotransferase family protein, partial [Pseudomonadales bacterium]